MLNCEPKIERCVSPSSRAQIVVGNTLSKIGVATISRMLDVTYLHQEKELNFTHFTNYARFNFEDYQNGKRAVCNSYLRAIIGSRINDANGGIVNGKSGGIDRDNNLQTRGDIVAVNRNFSATNSLGDRRGSTADCNSRGNSINVQESRTGEGQRRVALVNRLC